MYCSRLEAAVLNGYCAFLRESLENATSKDLLASEISTDFLGQRCVELLMMVGGIIWNHMRGASGVIWDHLGASGIIWAHLV